LTWPCLPVSQSSLFNSARLRAAIDESREHLFAASGYQPDIFADVFLPLEQAD
jgi:hypothetical protein